jgi:hypothetical protein
MTEEQRFTIGTEARCTDGVCGHVIRVVIDPTTMEVTHLVVEPTHREGLGRLVPLASVEESSADHVDLRATTAEFEEFGFAEESQFLPASGGHADYEAGDVLAHPYFGLDGVIGDVPQVVTYDAIPLDEVEVRRGEPVHATDGTIGSVRGLVIDRVSHRATHVLLEEGHLWGRKQVAIPIGAVTGAEGGIHLDLSRQQVEDLPAVGDVRAGS